MQQKYQQKRKKKNTYTEREIVEHFVHLALLKMVDSHL